jgi:YegS/Rv2252/BmrU family lipid kinase
MNQWNIALAVNPLAGKGRALKVSAGILAVLHKMQIRHSVFTHNWPRTFDDFTDVWITGGDGTLNYFINHYPSIQLPLSIFKGGTGNDFSWKLYGDISFEEQVNRVLQSAPVPVDAARSNEYLFLNGVGIGFDGEILESMKAIRFIGGHMGYYLLVLKKILSFKESVFEIYSHHQILHEKLLLVMINNSSRTGGGFHVSPKASVTDGLLDLVIAKPVNILKRFFYLPKVQKGKHLDMSFVKHVVAEEFTVECEKEMPAQLDGDLIRASRFTISILKNKFLFRF